MNETAAKATPRTSHSHGNGLNGGCSVPLEIREATAKSPIEAEGAADPVSTAPVASLAVASRVSSGTEQPPFNPFPWLWLVLGVAFAAVSFILGRWLRSV